MGEKPKVTTIMVLKVDLQCYRCYKKVKKVLSKFPQIQDQVYDEKNNTVTIKVVYCCPEKIKEKICYKGGDSIKSIEIKPPPKPKEPEKSKEKPKETEKPKEPEKPKETEKPKEPQKPKESVPLPPAAVLVPVCPPPPGIPIGVCCREYSEGYIGGPYFQGHGGGPAPYYEAYGRPVYDSYGGGYGRPCNYVSEENPAGCTIM